MFMRSPVRILETLCLCACVCVSGFAGACVHAWRARSLTSGRGRRIDVV